jgi:ATP-binding cassette subfamily B protein
VSEIADDRVASGYDARLLRRLLVYLRPHVLAVVVAFAAILLSSAAELAQPWLTQQAIDRYIVNGDLEGLNRVAVLFGILLIVSFVAEYVQTYVLQTTGQRIMHRLRMQVYAHLQRLDVRYYDRHPVGRLMTRVTTDVDALNDLFASGLVSLPSAPGRHIPF